MARPLRLSVGLWIDAGAATGGGHARRALTLARALEARGHRTVTVAEDTRAVEEATDAALHPVAPGLEAPAARSCDAWVVDRAHTRPASTGQLAALRARSAALVCFDANDRAGRWCDLHVSAVPLGPAGCSAGAARRLWGPHFAVVAAREAAATTTQRGGMVFGFGASDPTRLSEAALAAKGDLGPAPLRLIVGPLVAPERRADLRARAAARGVEIVETPRDVSALFSAAEIAVVPYGQMALEAVAAGCAIAMWHPSAEHAEVGRQFAAQCAAWPIREIGWGERAAVHVASTVATLRDAPRPAAPPVDYRGAERIVTALEGAVRHPVERHAKASPFDTTEIG